MKIPNFMKDLDKLYDDLEYAFIKGFVYLKIIAKYIICL